MPTTISSKYKVGDQVIVSKAWMHPLFNWNQEMNRYIGKSFKISEIKSIGPNRKANYTLMGVMFWVFNEESLESLDWDC